MPRPRSAFIAGAAWLCCCALLSSGPAQGADSNKVLRVAFEEAETGFDPVKVSDVYSNDVILQTMESLLTYDYLARPAKLVPNAAESLPDITDKGRTYTLRVRKGIYFPPDPAFKGPF